ncbi:RHS repeat domain-containing protein [Proteus sp. NMG38-2]|uniref:RHS repeat domain-containing protein n=1 Tax=Proteus sp. NMG38-2 TaxID=2883107 RepID=UPI001D0A2B41|nr:RHS repeat-associated core domain-containing protein [Proteus sp. NMG38-2]UDN35177.1 RHS domain-containing protein [Proteus sp. NMG38-2]
MINHQLEHHGTELLFLLLVLYLITQISSLYSVSIEQPLNISTAKFIPMPRYQPGKLHYVVTDHQGTPHEIFSEKGIVSWAGRLNTWGQMAFWQSHDNYADNNPEYTECHFRFAGQYEDKESGLYYNRFRYYDKDTGQYISPDPIGLLDSFNLYRYEHCLTG